MLVAVQSFGSIWTARCARTATEGTNLARRGAYYNTTGVLAGDVLRNRSCIYGQVRVDECSGFHPQVAERFIHRVFESEGVTAGNGRNKLFLRQIASAGARPDVYLFRIRPVDLGWLDRDGAWKCDAAQIVSFSEGNGQQEILIVLPPFGWVRGTKERSVRSRGEIGHGWWCYRARRNEAGMRYSKGTIALSQTQDLPLLRQVMYSKYVTQTQLWQFMRHSGYELSRGSFWWRVKRLEDHGFITRHSLPMAHRDPIFAIASSGLVFLVENVGTPYNGPEAGPDIRVDGAGVAHALGVNEVHLDLLRSRALVSWENEMEIRCRNEVADTKYAKDYDAIVTLALGGRQLLFALEYERTPKAQTEYDRIVSLLERERNLDRVLYLAGTRHIRSLLKQRLWRIRQRVLIGLASDLPKTEPAGLEVVDAQTMQVYRLVDIP